MREDHLQNKSLKDSASIKPKRMSVSLTKNAVENLMWLAEAQHISQGEALRRAIATEKIIQEGIQQGAEIIIRKNGSDQKIVFPY